MKMQRMHRSLLLICHSVWRASSRSYLTAEEGLCFAWPCLAPKSNCMSSKILIAYTRPRSTLSRIPPL